MELPTALDYRDGMRAADSVRSTAELAFGLPVRIGTGAFLTAAAPIFLTNTSWSTNLTLPILRGDTANPPRRFTTHDLYWEDDPGRWNRQASPSTTMTARG